MHVDQTRDTFMFRESYPLSQISCFGVLKTSTWSGHPVWYPKKLGPKCLVSRFQGPAALGFGQPVSFASCSWSSHFTTSCGHALQTCACALCLSSVVLDIKCVSLGAVVHGSNPQAALWYRGLPYDTYRCRLDLLKTLPCCTECQSDFQHCLLI